MKFLCYDDVVHFAQLILLPSWVLLKIRKSMEKQKQKTHNSDSSSQQDFSFGNLNNSGLMIRSLVKPFRELFFSCSVVSNSLGPHGLKHARLPCPSPSPRACSNSCPSRACSNSCPSRACSNSCPSSRWCHPTISSSVVSFSSCLQSFPASGSFLMSRLFPSGGQRIRASASSSGNGRTTIPRVDYFHPAHDVASLLILTRFQAQTTNPRRLCSTAPASRLLNSHFLKRNSDCFAHWEM